MSTHYHVTCLSQCSDYGPLSAAVIFHNCVSSSPHEEGYKSAIILNFSKSGGQDLHATDGRQMRLRLNQMDDVLAKL